ncbi:MAG: phosphotyrosine protein phosphatase [Agathobacter sp.]|nr:phosphotyrosine protein phosphatase [Agathobacter sp.]
MDKLERIIFVARSGTCREPMAMGILKDLTLKFDVEVLARGLVVSFPEPMNGKAEAVLISNGITLENFTSKQLKKEDITENTLVLTMEKGQREKVLSHFENAHVENVYVLTDFVGDELEIIDPYGGNLQSYGLCYETLRKSIKKLVKILSQE